MEYLKFPQQHQLHLYKVKLGTIQILANLTYGTMTVIHNSGLNLAITPWDQQAQLELLVQQVLRLL
jgi:hypothetical protein